MRILRSLGLGGAAGAAAALAAMPLGLAGGPGWQRSGAGKALGVVLIILLLVLLGTVTTAEYGRHVGIRLTEEERRKRLELVPFLLGMVVVVLASYLLILPPPLDHISVALPTNPEN